MTDPAYCAGPLICSSWYRSSLASPFSHLRTALHQGPKSAVLPFDLSPSGNGTTLGSKQRRVTVISSLTACRRSSSPLLSSKLSFLVLSTLYFLVLSKPSLTAFSKLSALSWICSWIRNRTVIICAELLNPTHSPFLLVTISGSFLLSGYSPVYPSGFWILSLFLLIHF